MTDQQAAELIRALQEMKEHIAVIRDITEATASANLTDEQKREIEDKSRVRRGMGPRPRN